jgi:VWFA-related protein
MNRPGKVFVLLLSAALLVAAAPQQKAAPQKKTIVPAMGETVEVSIVNVDVFVTDRQGNRVRGLTADDFEILENGQPRQITNFAEYSSIADRAAAGVEASDVVPEVPASQKRTVAIFFERMLLTRPHAEAVVGSMKALVRQTVRPGDAVTVVYWDRGTEVQVDYTDDVARIERALDAIGKRLVLAQVDDARQAAEHIADIRRFEMEVQAGATRDGGAALTVLDPVRAGAATQTLGSLAARLEMNRRVAAITATIHSIAGGEGKKVLLLATRRLGDVAGAELFYAGGQPRVVTGAARNEFGTGQAIKSIIDNANAANVTVYPIYPPGLGNFTVDKTGEVAPAFDNLVLMNETMSLSQIAERTGGLTAHGEDVVRLLPRIQDDVLDYYSLAYSVAGAPQNRARTVEVRTRKRDLVVRSRRQYVEKSDDTRMSDRVVATLYRTMAESQLPITAELGAARSVRGVSTTPLKVRIPIGPLTILPDGDNKQSGAFSVFVASGAGHGEVSPVTKMTQSYSIPNEQIDRAFDSHYTYNMDLRLDEKTRYVAVGVFDEVSKLWGVVRIDVRLDAQERKAARETQRGTH